MIKSITVTNHLDESIKLELGFPEKSGFLIQEITGLGPGKADINFTEIATGDGSVFNSSRVNTRNIVMTLRYLESPTIEDTRLKSYKYFPIKRKVRLLFETDNRLCETYGHVETNDPNVFSQNSTAQISIICADPYFYSPGTNVVVFSGLDSQFEFPFSNDSLTDDLILLGKIQGKSEHNIYYDGDAETGVVMYITALGVATNVNVYNVDTRQVLKIDTTKLAQITGQGLIEGDELVISTIQSDKYVRLNRAGVTLNVLNCLDRTSDWPGLAKGNNVFAYTADTGITNLKFRIENKMVYEGV